jgi:hypothetical protein
MWITSTELNRSFREIFPWSDVEAMKPHPVSPTPDFKKGFVHFRLGLATAAARGAPVFAVCSRPKRFGSKVVYCPDSSQK